MPVPVRMLILLDLDNTLADRAGAVTAWIEEFCVTHELPAEAYGWMQTADNDGYADRTSVFEQIRERYGLAEPTEQLLAAYRQRVVELVRPSVGAIACLTGLRAMGATLAILSNGSSGQQHAKIDRLGLRDLVDAVVVSGDLDIKKPDERIFVAAVHACGLAMPSPGAEEAPQIWMVGDSPTHDIVGAAAIGLRTAWLHRGRTWDHETVTPDLTLDSLLDLNQFFADR